MRDPPPRRVPRVRARRHRPARPRPRRAGRSAPGRGAAARPAARCRRAPRSGRGVPAVAARRRRGPRGGLRRPAGTRRPRPGSGAAGWWGGCCGPGWAARRRPAGPRRRGPPASSGGEQTVRRYARAQASGVTAGPVRRCSPGRSRPGACSEPAVVAGDPHRLGPVGRAELLHRSPRGGCGPCRRTGGRRAITATGAPYSASRSVSSSRGVSGQGGRVSASAASDGSTYRPPACTRRITSASAPPGEPLGRKPRAPAVSACRRCAGRPCPVRITTAHAGRAPAPARRPPRCRPAPGISRSTTATSGRCASAASTAAPPVGGLGHHLEVRLQAEQGGERQPDQFLVVGEQDADHGGHRHGRLQGEDAVRPGGCAARRRPRRAARPARAARGCARPGRRRSAPSLRTVILATSPPG